MADNYDRDSHEHDMTYENEQSMVTIPLREYDKLREQGQYIGDTLVLISIIDKIEELTRALRETHSKKILMLMNSKKFGLIIEGIAREKRIELHGRSVKIYMKTMTLIQQQ